VFKLLIPVVKFQVIMFESLVQSGYLVLVALTKVQDQELLVFFFFQNLKSNSKEPELQHPCGPCPLP